MNLRPPSLRWTRRVDAVDEATWNHTVDFATCITSYNRVTTHTHTHNTHWHMQVMGQAGAVSVCVCVCVCLGAITLVPFETCKNASSRVAPNETPTVMFWLLARLGLKAAES